MLEKKVLFPFKYRGMAATLKDYEGLLIKYLHRYKSNKKLKTTPSFPCIVCLCALFLSRFFFQEDTTIFVSALVLY